MRISLQFSLRLPLRRLFERAEHPDLPGRLLSGRGSAIPAARLALIDEMQAFVLERLQALLLDEGVAFPYLRRPLRRRAGMGGASTYLRRARRPPVLRGRAVAYNRCFSLASKAGAAAGAVDPALFTDEAERVMAAALDDVRRPSSASRTSSSRAPRRRGPGCAPAVDRYFEDVLVMDKDARVRANRLAQLAQLSRSSGGSVKSSRLPLPDDQT